jgi:hypothetical protein
LIVILLVAEKGGGNPENQIETRREMGLRLGNGIASKTFDMTMCKVKTLPHFSFPRIHRDFTRHIDCLLLFAGFSDVISGLNRAAFESAGRKGDLFKAGSIPAGSAAKRSLIFLLTNRRAREGRGLFSAFCCHV